MNTVYGTLNVHNNISDCSKQRKSVIADIRVINGYKEVLNCVRIIHFDSIVVWLGETMYSFAIEYNSQTFR